MLPNRTAKAGLLGSCSSAASRVSAPVVFVPYTRWKDSVVFSAMSRSSITPAA